MIKFLAVSACIGVTWYAGGIMLFAAVTTRTQNKAPKRSEVTH